MFPSWVEWMLDGIIFSWPPQSGRASREIQKFRSMPPSSVSLVERTFKYIFSENLPSKSFENTSWCWSGSTRWNTKCVFKICHASTLFEFIRSALNCESTDEESHGKQRLNWMNIVTPQRNIKHLGPIAHHYNYQAQIPGKKVCHWQEWQTELYQFSWPRQNFDILNFFQTQLEERPKHLFLYYK